MPIAGELMMLPEEAVIDMVPSAPAVPVGVTIPADTVAMVVLLEVHTAIEVISIGPLHVFAVALIVWLVLPPLLSVKLVGFRVIDWMQPTVTVTVCVPLMDGFLLEVAVTVADPVLTDVTKPEEEIVATLVGVMLQETDGLLVVLPSLLVPNTLICTVLSVFPVWMVGDAGPTEIEDSVGVTKKPVQLTAVAARMASAARAPERRSFRFADDMVM